MGSQNREARPAFIAPSRRIANVWMIVSVWVLLAFPSIGFGAEPDSGKLESGLERFGTTDLPVNLTADHLEYIQESAMYLAEGHVEASQGALHLSADRAEYHQKNSVFDAIGSVVMTDGENTISGDRITIDLSNQTGVIANGRILTKKDHYRLEGTVLERLGDDRYRIREGTFTACESSECRKADWKFRADQMNVQLDRYLTARNVIFYIKDVPTGYMPYLIFPIKRSRQTGFLIPRFGYSSQGGQRFNEAFYWVIADNQDATFQLDYRGSKGTGGGLEYRYRLSRKSYGQFEGSMFHDLETESNRFDGKWRHVQSGSDNLYGRVDARYVNDRDLFRDLSEVITESVQRSIESNVYMTRTWDTSDVTLLARYTQDLTSRNVKTLQRLPELRVGTFSWAPWDLPIYVNFSGSATHFHREEGLRLQRADLFPSVEASLSGSGWSVVPRAGIRETAYTKDADGSGTAHREAAYLSLTGRAILSRVYQTEGWGSIDRLKHVIEPEVTYEYVPTVNQSDIPVMDEIDRLSGKNLLTIRLFNRFFARTADEKGDGRIRQLLDLRLTQGVDIQQIRREQSSGVSGKALTDFRAELSIKPVDTVELRTDGFFNWNDHSLRAVYTDATFRVTQAFMLQAGHYVALFGNQAQRGDLFSPFTLSETQFNPQTVNFVTGRTEIALWNHALVGAAFFYDLKAGQVGETNYGVKYIADCWSLALGYRIRPNQRQFSFMVNLTGADTVSASTFGDLFKPVKEGLF